jgi:hypothetical protein
MRRFYVVSFVALLAGLLLIAASSAQLVASTSGEETVGAEQAAHGELPQQPDLTALEAQVEAMASVLRAQVLGEVARTMAEVEAELAGLPSRLEIELQGLPAQIEAGLDQAERDLQRQLDELPDEPGAEERRT